MKRYLTVSLMVLAVAAGCRDCRDCGNGVPPPLGHCGHGYHVRHGLLYDDCARNWPHRITKGSV